MNPSSFLIAGILIYFATVSLNRFLSERNYGSLAPEDKLKLTDAFSTHRSLATYIPTGIMLIVIAIGYSMPQTFRVAFPVGVVLVLIVSFSLQITILRNLNEMDLPGDYVAKFRLQSTLVQIGNVAAMSMLAYAIGASVI